MYTVESSHGARFASCSMQSENKLLYAVIEKPDDKLEDLFHQCLQDSIHQHGVHMKEGCTFEVAKNLNNNVFDKWDTEYGTWLLFTAVLCTHHSVEVCSASANRIYIHRSDEIQQTIHEQTVEYDLEAQEAISLSDMKTYRHRANAITRAIGMQRIDEEHLSFLPFLKTCTVQIPYQITVCSTLHYQGYPPSEICNMLKMGAAREENRGLELFTTIRAHEVMNSR